MCPCGRWRSLRFSILPVGLEPALLLVGPGYVLLGKYPFGYPPCFALDYVVVGPEYLAGGEDVFIAVEVDCLEGFV